MAKKSTTDLISAFTWAFNVIDNDEIPAAEQLTLLHVMSRANRAFWRPIPLSAAKLAAAMCKDKRSVDKALKALIKRGLLVETEGGFVLGIPTEQLNPFSGSAAGGQQPADAARRYSEGGTDQTERRTADADAGARGGIRAAEDGTEDPDDDGLKYFVNSLAEDRRKAAY